MSVLQMWRLVQVIDTPVTPIAFSLAMVGGGPGGVRMLDMAKRFDSGESLTYT
jgi:hypothetical protein